MLDFDKDISTVFETYHQRIETENALMSSLSIEEGMKRRDEFLLPVGEEVGTFMYQMVKASKAQTILEVGTSYGYSTLWLACAAKEIGAKVITFEIDNEKANYAIDQLVKAGLANVVDFRVGDAVERIKAAPEMFDFVLVDIWKELYVPAFNVLYPKLNPGAYLVGDNMTFPPSNKKEATEYRNAIRATQAFDSVLLPIGSGIEVSQLLEK